jgi:death on curing protein
MSARRREPRWLTRQMLDAMHEAQLREHGGMPGVRDEALVESALARPRNKIAYSAKRDWAVLAAAYAFGLAKNHGFIDGNKRIAFVAAYVFLGLNGHELDATESEVVAIMEGVAAGTVKESALAKWFRARIRPL